jgi:glycosyltransferase involved in cell wall biosynthesis
MPLLTFVPAGMGGSETYVRALVHALADRADVGVTVLVSPAARGSFPGVQERVVTRVRGGASSAARLRTLAQASLPGAEARAELADADVVHYPFTVPVPGAGSVPWVETLLDVQHLDLPAMFSRAERAYRVWAYDRAAKRADRVITISEFSKQRIVDHLGIDPGRIDVAHLGVDLTEFTYSAEPREQFVLYPANAWPHKNHHRLLQAMTLVRAARPELRLVLTGGSRAALGALPEWVEHRGHVPTPELRQLYRSAACLVYPSLYEGFGLPPLEAMASGCPVAASRSGSLPEICGDAAVLFDPHDVDAIAAGVLEAIEGAQQLVPAGVARVAGFTWEKCADAHVASFCHSLEGSPR